MESQLIQLVVLVGGYLSTNRLKTRLRAVMERLVMGLIRIYMRSRREESNTGRKPNQLGMMA